MVAFLGGPLGSKGRPARAFVPFAPRFPGADVVSLAPMLCRCGGGRRHADRRRFTATRSWPQTDDDRRGVETAGALPGRRSSFRARLRPGRIAVKTSDARSESWEWRRERKVGRTSALANKSLPRSSKQSRRTEEGGGEMSHTSMPQARRIPSLFPFDGGRQRRRETDMVGSAGASLAHLGEGERERRGQCGAGRVIAKVALVGSAMWGRPS